MGGAPDRAFGRAPPTRDSGRIDGLIDIARFRPEDPDALVTASLACPVCLRGEDIEWSAALRGYDPSVQCRCPSCEERWLVYLAPEQTLRLSLITHAHAA